MESASEKMGEKVCIFQNIAEMKQPDTLTGAINFKNLQF